MKRTRWTVLVLALAVLGPARTEARLELPRVFGDGMVMQRDKPVKVCTYDLGHIQIHSPLKRPIGERAARWALADVYKIAAIAGASWRTIRTPRKCPPPPRPSSRPGNAKQLKPAKSSRTTRPGNKRRKRAKPDNGRDQTGSEP